MAPSDVSDGCPRSREAGTPSVISDHQPRKIAAAALTVGVLPFGAVARSDDDVDNPIDTVDNPIDTVGDVVDTVGDVATERRRPQRCYTPCVR